MNILFLIRALDVGGAQRQAVTLAKALKAKGHSVAVAVFYPGGVLETVLNADGIPVISLDKRGRWEIIGFLRRLRRLVEALRPDVVHGYLTMANILTIALKPRLSDISMVWGVRASDMDLNRYHWLHRLTWRLECRLSRHADRIIVNSRAGLRFAASNGFPRSKMVVIPNGIDTDRFRPAPRAGLRQRRAWRIDADEPLIGLVARIDPMKGHSVFLEAAARIIEAHPDARFVCVGDGPTAAIDALKEHTCQLGLESRLLWPGAENDMTAVYNALDIAVSASIFGEGFSNTIAEAMACEVPCIATDVGDSAWLVNDHRCIVPAADPDALARACRYLLSNPAQRTALAQSARRRIEQNFSVAQLADHTEQLLAEAIQ